MSGGTCVCEKRADMWKKIFLQLMTEIISVKTWESRHLQRNYMRKGRHGFGIVTVGGQFPRVLAVGGQV